jgi:hypothetical protein
MVPPYNGMIYDIGLLSYFNPSYDFSLSLSFFSFLLFTFLFHLFSFFIIIVVNPLPTAVILLTLRTANYFSCCVYHRIFTVVKLLYFKFSS